MTSYQDTYRLVSGVTYEYRVRARGTLGLSDWATSNGVMLDRPEAPSDLAAAALGSARIALSWTDNSSDETGFRIERKSGGGSFAAAGWVEADATSAINSGLTPNVTYTYRVRAYRGAGGYDLSLPSGEAQETTIPLPAAPSGLTTLTLGSGRIGLSWTDNSSDETGFRLERKSGGGSFATVANLAANSTTCANTGLAPFTAYVYRIRAYRGVDYSAYSDEVGGTTLALPAAPTGLAATVVSSTRINLSWTDNSSDETGFRLERKSGGGSFATVVNLAANGATWTNIGLAPDTAYVYRIRAYRGVDYSPYSDEANGTTLALPAAPTGLTAAATGSRRLDLAWTDQATDETGYKVERKSGGGSFKVIATLGANAASYSNTGLSGGVAYTYRVRAYRGIDFSAYTNEAAATANP